MTTKILETTSPIEIRKNWYKYKLTDIPEHTQNLIYNDWYKTNNGQKLGLSKKHEEIIKKFIFGKPVHLGIDENNNKIRYKIHDFCSKLGLDHDSQNKGDTRILCIDKPNNWSWEFSKSELQKKRDKQKSKTKKPKTERSYNRRRPVRECENCDASSNDTELLVHYNGAGPYCEECLDILTDGEGNELSAYKFEPLYY